MQFLLSRVKRQSIDQLINMETYDRQTGLIFTRAGGKNFAGRAYEMSPLLGGGGDFPTIVQTVFKSLPIDSIIQCLEICYPDDEALDAYRSGKPAGGTVIQKMVERQVDLMRQGLSSGFDPDVPFLNKRKVLMTLMVPIRSINAAAIDEQRTIQNEFLTGLRGCNFWDARALTPGELLGWYGRLADPWASHEAVELDEELELRFQAFGPDLQMDFTDASVGQINEHYMATVAVKGYPGTAAQGIMNFAMGAPFNTGDVMDGGGSRFMTPHIICTSTRIADQAAEAKRVKEALESRGEKNPFPIALGNENAVKKVKDLQLIKARCSDGEDKFVFTSTTFFVFGRTRAEALDSASTVRSHLSKLKFDVRLARGNGHVRWMQSLPLNYSRDIADQLANETIIYSTAAALFMPIMGDHPGMVLEGRNNRSGTAFVTRRGGVHYHDAFATQTNPHGVIAAEPGAGKSFLLQKRMQDDLAQGDYVVLFEVGASSKKFTLASGGEFNEFSTSEPNPPSLNPYTGLAQEEFDEQQEMITAMLLMMCYDGEPPISGSAIAMGEASRAAFAKKLHTTEIEDVIDSLTSIRDSALSEGNEVQQAATNLIPRLNAFINSPIRGQFFKGPNSLNPKQQLTVFELRGLEGDKHLFKVVLYATLNTVVTRMAKMPGVRKHIYIDEANDIFKDANAAPVVEGIYFKGRKDAISIFTVVQSLLKLPGTGALHPVQSGLELGIGPRGAMEHEATGADRAGPLSHHVHVGGISRACNCAATDVCSDPASNADQKSRGWRAAGAPPAAASGGSGNR